MSKIYSSFLTRVDRLWSIIDCRKDFHIKMPICGPKLSLCGLVLSVWGIIQLTLMGVFYYIGAVALLEDLPLDENPPPSIEHFIGEVESGYTQNAYNCWIAALLYVVTLAFSAQQFWMNHRSSVSM